MHDIQATSKMLSWFLVCAFCLNESHESTTHSHYISCKKCSIYPLCGQQLNSPPLSPEFCMRAQAAMWKRGLRDGGGKGVRDWKGYPCPLPPLCLFFLLFSFSLLYIFSNPAQLIWLRLPAYIVTVFLFISDLGYISWAAMFWLSQTISTNWSEHRLGLERLTTQLWISFLQV